MLHRYPNKFSSNKYYKVPEVTEFLVPWALSKNDKKTRELIIRGRLKATKAGNDPDDRRSGYKISEKAIYDFITSQIPTAKHLIDFYHEHSEDESKSKPKIKPKSKPKSKTDKVTGIEEAAATKE